MAFVAVAIGAAAIGSVASGVMSSNSASKAAGAQTDALNKAQANLNNLDPSVVNAQALTADQTRAKERLALQAQIDPSLAAQRPVAEQQLSSQLAGVGTSASDAVAAQAAAEALKVTPGAEAAKDQLVAAAAQQLKLGASLPPDVQAQLMQAGLEQSGSVTGAAGGQAGSAGNMILQQVLGTAGIQLQQQRQTQAAALLTQAGNLDAQRQQILQGLFPKLQAQQLGNISATSNILGTGNSMLPEAGLSGANVANIWLAKVGATNQLTQQQGNVTAQGILGQQAGINSAVGGATGALPGFISAINSTANKSTSSDPNGIGGTSFNDF